MSGESEYSQASRLTHRLFIAGVLLKAVNGLGETVGGSLLLLLSTDQMRSVVALLTSGELREDPGDVLANLFLRLAGNATPHGQHFAAAYLLSHGVIKLFLVWYLLRGRLWAYPVAIAALLLFILYQMEQLLLRPSAMLWVLTVLDAVLIFLTWREYRLKKMQA